MVFLFCQDFVRKNLNALIFTLFAFTEQTFFLQKPRIAPGPKLVELNNKPGACSDDAIFLDTVMLLSYQYSGFRSLTVNTVNIALLSSFAVSVILGHEAQANQVILNPLDVIA